MVISFSLALFLTTKSPFFLSLLLVILSFSVGRILGLGVSKWLTYSLILIFLGGIIVVFLYVRMLTLDTKFQLKINSNLMHARFGTLGLLFFLLLIFSEEVPHLPHHSAATSVSLIYATMLSPLIVFLISYLLRALFLIVEICQRYKGSLQKKWGPNR